MNSSPRKPFRSVARRLAILGGVLAVCGALAPAAPAWGPPEAAPVLDPSIIQPASSMRLREDNSAVYLARGLDVASDDVTQLVVRPPGGPAAFASPFAGGFGRYTTTSLLLMSPLDAVGNLLAIRQASPYDAAFLAPGADPAGIAVEATPARVSHVDVAPSGEAAAIVGGGSTASVSFRAAGPGGRFDTPRELDRAGNQRSYGIGITIDPDGGVFVVYRTEQERAVLQAYAPPGEDFGAPQPIDISTETMAVFGWDPIYAQSANGHAMLVWSESTGGNSNAEQVWAATRTPGGLLGPKSLVDEIPGGNRALSETTGGITDDGTQYVAYRDFAPVSGCPTNIDGDGSAVLAVRPLGGAWTRAVEPGVWPKRTDFAAIATAGNRVGLVVLRSTDTGNKCDSSDPSSSLGVRLGQSGSLGSEVTVASESVTSDQYGNVVQLDGFAINGGGSALLLSDQPQGGSTWKRFLHFHDAGAAPPTQPGPNRPLPAPGRIVLSGKKLVARGGKIPFEASCARLGPGDKIYCHVAAIVAERGPRILDPARISAAKAKPKKQKAKKKVARKLATAKAVKIAPGKRKTVTLRLNKLGTKQLRRSGKKGLQVTLLVTIRKAGAKTLTIKRKVKLVAGKPKKKPGKGKAKGKKKR